VIAIFVYDYNLIN